MAIQDEGSRSVNKADDEIRRLGGSKYKSGYRGSHALIGYSGKGRPYWIRDRQAPRKRGPSTVAANIKLNQRIPIPPPVRPPGKLRVASSSVSDWLIYHDWFATEHAVVFNFIKSY